MSRIDRITLRCLDPEAQRAFYCSALDMERQGEDTVGYPGEGASLHFVKGHNAYRPSPADLYWKIALAVPDLDLACAQLLQKGVSVGSPEQFGDIGYLAHVTDPEGFTVELIAHRFKGQKAAREADRSKLGGGPTLNLLTLRTTSAEAVVSHCEDWGMKLLAIMPVEKHGFTLHFYAFTDQDPPSSDPLAIENRTWVYQRPYTVLEIQHRPSPTETSRPAAGSSGYVEATVSGAAAVGAGSAFCLTAKGTN